MGLREEKRQQTLKRITQTALGLFARHGYEATTLDMIAADAGISRRTFFHYFKSKDDILLSQQAGLGEQLVDAIAAEPTGGTPIKTVQAAMRRIAASYPLEELVAIDKLMMSVEAVQSANRPITSATKRSCSKPCGSAGKRRRTWSCGWSRSSPSG